MTITFVVLGLTVALFMWGRIPADLVGLLSALALFVAGVITARQAVAGFGDPAVVMIAALFVVGEGLSNSGLTAWLSSWVIRAAQGSQLRLLVLVMVGTAVLSAFVSNTGTVATLLPAVVAAAWAMKTVPSKLLIPLAFAANTGGLLTLTGTPPNIIVTAQLEDAGLEPFGFFEFSLIGLPLLATAVAYMALARGRLLPERESAGAAGESAPNLQELAEAYGIQSSLFRVRVEEGSPLAGRTLEETQPGRRHGMPLLRIERAARDSNTGTPKLAAETRLEVDDILTVRMARTAQERTCTELGLETLRFEADAEGAVEELLAGGMGVAELIIVPRSPHVGQQVQVGAYSEKHGVQLLALHRRGRTFETEQVLLEVGDSLLVRGPWDAIERLSREPRAFAVLGNPDAIRRARLSPKATTAAVIMVAMVVAMVAKLMPTSLAAVAAAVAMVLFGCATKEGAYRSVSWSSVVLIGAMIPIGTALKVSGGAELLADGLVDNLGAFHPLVLLIGVFLLTTGLSQVINNTATAVLVCPIVLQAAVTMGLSPRPLLLVVAVAASTAFLTPVGTSTNLLVYAPGKYRFTDYLKVGLPLSLLFLAVSALLIPLIWPLDSTG